MGWRTVASHQENGHTNQEASYIALSLLSLGSGHTGNLIKSLELSPIHVQVSPPRKRFLVGCSSPFMRLAGHLAALHAWCKQAVPTSSAKTRHAPSQHCSTPPPSIIETLDNIVALTLYLFIVVVFFRVKNLILFFFFLFPIRKSDPG